MISAAVLAAAVGLLLAIFGFSPRLIAPMACGGGAIALLGFHYLVWARWLGPLIREEVEREEEQEDVAADNEDAVDRLWDGILDDAGGTLPKLGPKGVVSE